VRLSDVLSENCIALQESCQSGLQALRRLTGLLSDAGLLYSENEFLLSVLTREEEEPTALGQGVAVPHGRSAAVRRPCMALMTLTPGIDYGAPDGLPVRTMFLLATPPDAADAHLQMLALVAELVGSPGGTERLLSCSLPQELYRMCTAM
jgi:PTS system fructose-specific IIC component